MVISKAARKTDGYILPHGTGGIKAVNLLGLMA